MQPSMDKSRESRKKKKNLRVNRTEPTRMYCRYCIINVNIFMYNIIHQGIKIPNPD